MSWPHRYIAAFLIPRRALSALAAALLLVAPGVAQDAEPLEVAPSSPRVPEVSADTLDLTLDEALALALRRNRGLQQVQIDLDLSAQDRRAAVSRRLPRFDLEARYTRKSDVPHVPLGDVLEQLPGAPDLGDLQIRMGDEDTYDTRLTLTQLLFSGGRIRHAIRASEHRLERSRWSLRAAEGDLILQVIATYFALAKAERAVEISTAARAEAEARANDVANLLAEGLTTRDELLRVDAHVGQMRIDLLSARNAADLARLQLLQLLALPLERPVELTSPVDELSRHIGDAGLEQRTRPELLALDEALHAAQRRVAVAEAGRLPTLSGMATAAYGRPGLDPFADEWSVYWTAGLALRWNLWDGGERRADIESARLAARRLAEARADAEARTGQEAEAARLQLAEARERVELARQVVAAALERHRIVADRFDQGLVTPSDLIEAQAEETQARLAEAAAVADLQVAIAARERALGQLHARADALRRE